MVMVDLTGAADKRFPESSVPDPREHESLGHEIFARRRAGLFGGRASELDQLSEFASATSARTGLIVTGEAGAGKSALLAAWSLGY